MLINEIIIFVAPLLLAGIIHHFFIIRNNVVTCLAKPIDGHSKIMNNYMFGPSKTWRGLISITLLNALLTQLLILFIPIKLNLNPLLFGAILGLGYSLGELPNSFVKRRLRIESSQSHYKGANKIFYIIDQTDSVLLSIIFLKIIYPASWLLMFYIFIIGTALHVLVDLLLHKYGYKKLSK